MARCSYINEGQRSSLALVWALLLLWPAALAFSKPLSEQEIKAAKKIVLLRGSFDPVHNGDLEQADNLIKQGKADVVLLMPYTLAGEEPVESIGHRLRLIEAAADKSEALSYPSTPMLQGFYTTQATDRDETFQSELRKINPSVQIEVVQRTLSLDTVSDGIRTALRLNPNLYVNHGGLPVPEAVETHIQTHASYLNNIQLPKPPEAEQAIRNEMVLIYRGLEQKQPGSGAIVKAKYAEALANRDVKELTLDGKVYPVLKWIGSGSMANAYLVKDGDRVLVAKTVNKLSESAELSRQTIAAHLWLSEHSNLPVPQMVAFDPNGSWILTSFVEGKTLSKWLRENPEPTAEQLQVLRDFYEKARGIQRVADLYLDIAADNIIMVEGKPVLVDTGPLPHFAAPQLFPPDADTAITRWKGAAAASSAEAENVSPGLMEVLCRFDFARLAPYR